MTIQERNEYLNEQSWFMRERQPIFDMEALKPGSVYNNYGQILQVTGISTEERKNKSMYYRDKLDYFLCTRKQKDGHLKITKVKGELVENPFSWEQKSPNMSNGYLLEMMIIYILDNHLNDNWSQYDWCNALGMITGNKKDYDLEDFEYPKEYFHTAYEAMKDGAQTRFRDIVKSLQSRGVIEKRVKIICRDHPNDEWRPFTSKEEKIYKHCLSVVFHTGEEVDMYSVKMYRNVFPKFISELRKYKEFKNLYFKFVYDLEYLYPNEHTYMREFEFYMYQKRLQQNLLKSYIKLAQLRKDDLINNYTTTYMKKVNRPTLEGLDKTEEELMDVSRDFIYKYFSKKHSRYGTHVRSVVNYIQKHGKLTPILGDGFTPHVSYETA